MTKWLSRFLSTWKINKFNRKQKTKAFRIVSGKLEEFKVNTRKSLLSMTEMGKLGTLTSQGGERRLREWPTLWRHLAVLQSGFGSHFGTWRHFTASQCIPPWWGLVARSIRKGKNTDLPVSDPSMDVFSMKSEICVAWQKVTRQHARKGRRIISPTSFHLFGMAWRGVDWRPKWRGAKKSEWSRGLFNLTNNDNLYRKTTENVD